ncbi:MAG: flavodoxin-dependent (E)-4-hydroxy-3-methylbut-2-enyl-diphosphate synthase [Coprobacillus sp.]|nr:flavodoxin-dependent (E)-4-hydroxy-3-methylbut-2-enyl-diphosphate synthase [Coprobacillus sp.]
MHNRRQTRSIKVANLTLGGNNDVIIQSMCDIKTENVEEVVNEINECASIGCQLMRIAIKDEKDARAIPLIKKKVSLPLVADIHFDYRLALLAMEEGIDKVRINPANIGGKEKIKLVVEKAKEKGIPLRLGFNAGSIEKKYTKESDRVKALLASIKDNVKYVESFGFYDIVLSAKCSSLEETLKVYRALAKKYKYPLHLGVTEAGISDVSLVRSSASLAPLLLEGIGSTMRISITGDVKGEVIAAKELLHDVGLYPNYPTLISCPICGRATIEVNKLAHQVYDYLQTINKPITVAVMGCVVNGIGEGKDADIGITGEGDDIIIFKKGEQVAKCKEKDAYSVFMKEIESL